MSKIRQTGVRPTQGQPQALPLVLLAGFLLVAFPLLSSHLRSLETVDVKLPAEARHYPAPEFLKTLSFGHLPVLIDLFWLRALQDVGLSHVSDGKHPLMYYDFWSATELDPLYFDAFYIGATLVSVVRDDGPGARDLLVKANKTRTEIVPLLGEKFKEEYWRDDWRILLTTAYVYLYDLQDIPEASKYFIELSAHPLCPPLLKNLGHKLQTVEGQYATGLRLTQFWIDGTQDPIIKKKYQERRDSLYVGSFLYEINQRFHEFLRSKYPYKPGIKIDSNQLQSAWKLFIKKTRSPIKDPLGGQLILDANGRIDSTTPRVSRLGMEY